jgi:hypothetical protein
MRVSSDEFLALDLKVHAIMGDVSLHDVSAVDLPGGGVSRTLSDVRALHTTDELMAANPAANFLFKLRFFLGRAFGWDSDPGALPKTSYIHRIGSDIKSASVLAPGTPDGPFRLLYVLDMESLAEIQNATVHAFVASALRRAATGYRLYWGVYVISTSRLTPLYLALIEPFRRFVVYPAMLHKIRGSWQRRYGPSEFPSGPNKSV